MDINQIDQPTLLRAKNKIRAINKNLMGSKGLTKTEIDVAIEAGLIDFEQRYWWMDPWQKGEREAERDEKNERFSGPFRTIDSLLAHLQNQRK